MSEANNRYHNFEDNKFIKRGKFLSSLFFEAPRRKKESPVKEPHLCSILESNSANFLEKSSNKNQQWWKLYQKSRDRQRCIQIFILCVFISLLLRFTVRSGSRITDGHEPKQNELLSEKPRKSLQDTQKLLRKNELKTTEKVSQKKIKTLSKISFETTLYNQVLSNSKGDLAGIHKLPPKCGQQTDASDSIDVSLVTQLSIDRLWMMQYHCQRWNHKISLIVYSQNDNKMTVDILQNKLVHEYMCSPEHIDRVQLHHGHKDEDYPVNKLRNLAISAISTTHFLYIDVDFWVSTNLYSSLITVLREKKYQSKKTKINPNESQLAIVVPAFQIHRGCREYKDCRSENLQNMPDNVLDLIQSIKDRNCLPFDPTNKHGHGSTMYKEWLESQLKEQVTGIPLDEMIALPCIHSDRYEPYVVVRYCDTLPPYQQEFVGYGKNKMTWIMQLQHYGYQFVHSLTNGGFLVHYPHLDSPVRHSWNDGPDMITHRKLTPKLLRIVNHKLDWMKYKRGQVDAIYVKFRHWLQTQTASFKDGKYGTPYCPDADENRIIQDEKLWVSANLMEKYVI